MDATERAAIVEEYRRIGAAFQPRTYQAHGCLTLIAAAFVAFGTPALLSRLPVAMPEWTPAAAIVLAVVLAIAGFLLMQARVLPVSPVTRAAHAIELLAAGGLDPAARRREAVALVFHAYDEDGPGVRGTFDVASARRALGDEAAYVAAVEQVLIDEKLAGWPVFTQAGPRAG